MVTTEPEITPPSGESFTTHDATASVCINGPSSETNASCTCCRTIIGKYGFLALSFGRQKFWRGTAGETSCLICVSVSRNDSRHKADSALHTITKVPRILDISTVLMMCKKKMASMKPITTIPYWRLRRNTRVINSWK